MIKRYSYLVNSVRNFYAILQGTGLNLRTFTVQFIPSLLEELMFVSKKVFLLLKV